MFVGVNVGFNDGSAVGSFKGAVVGACVGVNDGLFDGSAVGAFVGETVGDSEGLVNGLTVGTTDGVFAVWICGICIFLLVDDVNTYLSALSRAHRSVYKTHHHKRIFYLRLHRNEILCILLRDLNIVCLDSMYIRYLLLLGQLQTIMIRVSST